MDNQQRKHQRESIRNLLKRLGLHEKEVEVYLALLPIKEGRASTISKLSNQSRSHTYLVLESLVEKGLVSKLERGKVLHFIAESPRRLMGYLQSQEEQLELIKPALSGLIPHLETLSVPLEGQPRVTLLHGIEGVKQVYREVLPNEFCGIFNAESMYNCFGENIALTVMPKTLSFRGRDLLVDNQEAQRWIKEVPPNENYEIRLLPKDVTFQSDTNFSGDKVALFSYDDEQTIITIENKTLVNTFRAWFDLMWKMSTPVNS